MSRRPKPSNSALFDSHALRPYMLTVPPAMLTGTSIHATAQRDDISATQKAPAAIAAAITAASVAPAGREGRL